MPEMSNGLLLIDYIEPIQCKRGADSRWTYQFGPVMNTRSMFAAPTYAHVTD